MGAPAVRLGWGAAGGDRENRRDAAWALLRGLLADVGFSAAGLINPCPRCGGPHGPVRVSDAPFRASVTYAGGIAVAAIMAVTDADAFAIDAEPCHDPRRDRLGLTGVLGSDAAGARDAAAWTRVEAALKADGRGLTVDPTLVRIVAASDGWRAAVPGRPNPFEVRELAGPDGTVVSAAWLPSAVTAAVPHRSTR